MVVVFFDSRGERVKLWGTRKVWEIYFLSYPKVRSWHTFSVDKITAPHRWRYIVCLLGRVVYAYDVGAIVNHLYCMLKNGQVSQLKIIKNNTFSGAASLGGLHVARKCGAAGAATSAEEEYHPIYVSL